jgi:hypothetical protein
MSLQEKFQEKYDWLDLFAAFVIGLGLGVLLS